MKSTAIKNDVPDLLDLTSFNIHTAEGLLEIIDALPMAIAVIDSDRRLILANQLTYQFTNKNETQLIGRVGGEALGCLRRSDVPEGCGFGPHCLKCALRQTVADTMRLKKAHSMVETSMVFNPSGSVHLRISTQPLFLYDEEVVLLAIEDITMAKEHEHAVVEKEKLSVMVKTAGAVCHEISQPLMILSGLADLMMMDSKTHGILEKQLIAFKTQLERLERINEKMLKITRVETKPYLENEIIDFDASSDMKGYK